MLSKDLNPVQITTFHALNEALKALNPSISGIDSNMLETPGLNPAILDRAVAACPLQLMDGMKRAEVLSALKPVAAVRVAMEPVTLVYDTHGVKHFPGGPSGTKFVQSAAVVNPYICGLIDPLKGRIRRDANGRDQTYFLTVPNVIHAGGQPMAVQVDFVFSPEAITYHGYPRPGVVRFGLSRTLGGFAIP